MTLIQPPLMVTGAVHPARALRMMVRDLSRGSQGVTEGGDLKVRQTATPGPGVRVGAGSAIVLGAAFGQGSYTQYNVGDHLVPIAPTGGTGRTDLLVLRVEDPDFEGTRDPVKEDIGYFHVIPGVSATASAPPGMTALPLARITIPPNCQTVTDAMITDLRKVANPRSEHQVRVIGSFGYSAIGSQTNVWQEWPASAGAQVSIDVPAWATSAYVVTELNGLRITDSVNIGFRQMIAGVAGNVDIVDADAVSYMGRTRSKMVDQYWWRPEQRGTSQTLMVQAARYAKEGDIDVNGNTTMHVEVDFVEGVY
ncbi:hypothetical protein AB0O82_10685 [Kitasatospora sp. NPDC088264]|uniref:hypothetical protein n=1 Tax=Kitasatospora sp. NPDC088264 TaxID=3155296 RepID=UPI003420993B